MAGLVAIASERPGVQVSDQELTALVRCYQSLRSEPELVRFRADVLGAAALLGAADDASLGAERDGQAWSIHVGSLHNGHGPLAASDPASLDGQFALVRYDAARGRLEALSDPFGLQAVYLARHNGLSYVSTSALALAKHLRARPDVHGLEVFLRTGPHFGELTNWEGISRIPPATVVPVPGQQRTYWLPDVDRSLWSMPLRAAAQAAVDSAVATFRDWYGGLTGGWCDLTGGYDTRLQSLLLDRAGVAFATATNGADGDPDVRLARRIATMRGWRWRRSSLPEEWPETCEGLLADALAWGDGMLEVTQLSEVMALQRERKHEGAVIFNGGGGEHWRDYAWKQEMPLGGRTTHVSFDRWVTARFMHPVDVSVFRSDPTPRARASLVDRCRSYVAPYAHELNSVQLDMLYAYKAMAHFGAYQSAARGTIRVELPFYAKPAFLAAFSVSPRHRSWHRLARVAINMLDPRVAELRTTPHGDLSTPLSLRNAYRFVPMVTNRGRGAARKVTQNLPGPTVGALRVTTPHNVEAARRRVLDRFIRETGLDPARMRSGALYDRAALHRLAHSGEATTGAWVTLGRIITVEQALASADAALD